MVRRCDSIIWINPRVSCKLEYAVRREIIVVFVANVDAGSLKDFVDVVLVDIYSIVGDVVVEVGWSVVVARQCETDLKFCVVEGNSLKNG